MPEAHVLEALAALMQDNEGAHCWLTRNHRPFGPAQTPLSYSGLDATITEQTVFELSCTDAFGRAEAITRAVGVSR